MEEVEAANRAAVGSCHRVLNLLSRTVEQILPYRDLAAETGEAISRFRRVSSMLSTSVGHARVRRVRRVQSQFNHRIFSDSPLPSRTCLSPAPLRMLSRNFSDNHGKELESTVWNPRNIGGRVLLENSVMELDSATRGNVHCASQSSTAQLHFLQQQQSVQRYQQLQQQMKLQSEVNGRSSSGSGGVNLKFDSYSTATGSSAKSFLSSLSIDGSMASMDGKSFSLIHGSQSADHTNLRPSHKRRCYGAGEDGNGKCATSGRCHCSKKRKLRVKRSIKVPATSNKLADIPSDEYSWRKYGQKPIKGSPHPRNILKHKKKDFTLEELTSHMRTEEANRLKDKAENGMHATKANLVETGGPSNARRFKGKMTKPYRNKVKKSMQNKFTKPEGKVQKPSTVVCYVCGKADQKAYQCTKRQGPPKPVGFSWDMQ